MRDTRVTQGRTTRRRRATLRGLRWTPAAEFTSCSRDRKSTRLNSSHANISYAVFCLKKKKKKDTKRILQQHQCCNRYHTHNYTLLSIYSSTPSKHYLHYCCNAPSQPYLSHLRTTSTA